MTTDELVLPRTRNRSGGARCNLTFEVAVDQYEWLQAEADFSVSDRVQSALESGPVAHDPTAPTRTRGDQTKMITTWLRPAAYEAVARAAASRGWSVSRYTRACLGLEPTQQVVCPDCGRRFLP